MKKLALKLLKAVCFALICAFFLFPLLFIIAGSFMSDGEFAQVYGALASGAGFAKLRLLPRALSLDQIKNTLLHTPEVYRYFWNTVILTLPSLLGAVAVSSLGAYGFGKFEFKLKKALYFLFVITALLPFQLMMAPTYLVTYEMGLFGHRLSVIIPTLFMSLGVFLIHPFMQRVSTEVVESARIEGASEARVFAQIALPQALPGVKIFAMLVFAEGWSLSERAVIFISDKLEHPLSIYIANTGPADIASAFVSSVFFTVPLLIFFLYIVKDLISSIRYVFPSSANG